MPGADGTTAQMAAERDEAREQLAAAEARTAELQATLDAKVRCSLVVHLRTAMHACTQAWQAGR